MDFQDPITADFPSRNILPEEDEAAYERNMENQYLAKPEIELEPSFLEGLPSARSVVLLCGRVGSCLKNVLVDGSCKGKMYHPKLSHVAPGFESPYEKQKSTSYVYKGLYSTLVISVQDTPAQEQATTWVETVLCALNASSVVVVGSCPGYRYKGAFDGSEQDKIYSLHTFWQNNPQTCKPLPVGNLLSGIEAATMLYCELENIRASAYIVIELSQCPQYDLACNLGEMIMSELGQGELTVEAKECIKRFTMQQYATSAELSVYV